MGSITSNYTPIKKREPNGPRLVKRNERALWPVRNDSEVLTRAIIYTPYCSSLSIKVENGIYAARGKTARIFFAPAGL